MKINDRWEVLSDSCNYILREHYTSSKGKATYSDRYFPMLEQCLQRIVTEEGKGCESISDATKVIRTVRDEILVKCTGLK